MCISLYRDLNTFKRLLMVYMIMHKSSVESYKKYRIVINVLVGGEFIILSSTKILLLRTQVICHTVTRGRAGG